MRRNLSVSGAIAIAIACAASVWPSRLSANRAEKGLALVTKHCAQCHAVGATGDGAHKEAPAFRSVVTRYPVENLAEALAEGILSGHPDMPEFVFQPEEIESILSYLDQLKAETNGGTGDPGSEKQKQ